MSQQHNKFKSKIKLMVFSIVLICCMITVFIASLTKANAAAVDVNKVYLSFNVISHDNTKDNAEGNVNVYVIAQLEDYKDTIYSPIEVSVHVRTRNYTATSPDDYTAFDGIVHLTWHSGNKLYEPIKINTKKADYKIDGESPSFYVEIVEVLAENFSINESYSRAKINLATRYSVTSNQAYNTRMLDKYLTAEQYYIGWDTGEIIDQEGQSKYHYDHDKLNFLSRNSSLANAYKDVYKNLADIYVGNQADLGESTYHLSSFFDIDIYDYHTDRHLFSGHYKGMDNDDDTLCRFGNYLSEGEYNNTYPGEPDAFTDTSEDYDRAKNTYLRTSKGEIYIRYQNNSDYYRRIHYWQVCWILIDNYRPVLTKIDTDKDCYTSNDVINLTLKFNEPIQALGELDRIKIKATLEGTGDFNNKQVEFKCSKVGSNAAIFSFDPREYSGTISKIKINSFTNIDDIVDYGRTYNNRNNSVRVDVAINDLLINYDNTNPEVTIQGNPDSSINKSYTKTVTATGNELYGLYYVWSKDESISYDISKRYEFVNSVKNPTDLPQNLRDLYNESKDMIMGFIPKENLDANNQTQISLNNVTGDYYLHILGKSIYATKSTNIKCGPFKIDNDKPAISNITVSSDLSEKNVRFELSDYSLFINNNTLEGIKNIILYAKETPLHDIEGAKRILVFGTADPSEYDYDGTIGDKHVGLTINEIDGKVTLSLTVDCVKHLDFNDDKESGIYYLGFSVTDALDNKLELEKYGRSVLFDKRSAISAEIVDGTFLTEGYYVLDIKDNPDQVITIKTDDAYKAGYEYKVSSINRFDGNNQPVPIDITASNTYFSEYQFGDQTSTLSFKTNANSCGYYEINTCAIDKADPSSVIYASVIRLYIIDSSINNVNTLNYPKIYGENNLLTNIIYFLNSSDDIAMYYYRTNNANDPTDYMGSTSSEYYNKSNSKTLVFSSKEKAIEYVKAFEYQDLNPIVVDTAFMNSQTPKELGGAYRTPMVGEVWIRYKSPSWDYDKQQWAYYYSTFTSTDIDVTKLVDKAPLLANAINTVTNTIVNHGYLGALLKDNGGVDNNGVPYLLKAQIPDGDTFTKTKASATGTPLSNNTYTFDSAIYSNSVLDSKIATWYKFSYYPFTKLFYAPDGTNDFVNFTGSTLGSVINTSGKYTIKEYDSAGLRIYSVYVDKTEPTLDISYTTLENEAQEEKLGVINNGDFIHTKAFTIKENGFKDAIDDHSYLLIYDITTGKEELKYSFYAKDFNSELNLENDKIYKIIVGDRSGNSYTFKVSVTDKELNQETNPEITIIDNDKIIFTIKNRKIETISNFIVNHNGVENDLLAELKQVGNDCVIELKEAGEYDFAVSDLYGYSINLTAKLTRIKIAENENIVWYAKVGSAYDPITNITTTDDINYYIKSDKALYLKLDAEVLMPNEDDSVRPNAIYRYETTGNVTVERVVENENVYLKTSSAQSARWTLKLYYKDFTDNYVIYSRIDERGSSWLNDYEVSLSASLIEYNGQIEVIQDKQIKFYVVTKIPNMGGSENDKLSDLQLAAHIKTVSHSAIGGLDFDAIDENIYLTNKDYEVIYQPVYMNVRMLNYSVDGSTAYFNIELADVLAEGFGINNSHKSIKVIIYAKNRFASLYAYDTSMISEYLIADSQESGWDTGKIEDHEGEKFWKYFNYAERNTETARKFNSFVDRGWATLYVECDTNIDEKYVSLSSTFDICFYDRDSKGTQLFSGSYRKMNESKVYFGVSVSGGNVVETSANFAESPNAFKDTSENYSRTKGYYVRIPSRQLAISYVNGSDYFRRIYNWNNNWVIIDDKAPVITGWYIDNGNYRQGEKLNIIVTFDEPVHINGNASDVKLNAILKGSGSFSDKRVDFVCQGNLGLDRLVFTYDPSQESEQIGHIGNIVVSGVTNSNRILDYGRNISNANNSLGNLSNEAELKKNKMAPSDFNSDLTVKFDANKPHMTVLTGTSDNYQSTADVEIMIEGNEIAGVYYLASTDEHLYIDPNDPSKGEFNLAQRYALLSSITDESSKTLAEKLVNFSTDLKNLYNEISKYDIRYVSASELYASGNKLSIHLEGLTGNYYLYVLAKSAYSSDKDELNKLGVFKLSNAAPVIEDITASTESASKTITFKLSDFMIKYIDSNPPTLSGLYNLILHVSTSPLSNVDRNEVKMLLYGNYSGTDEIKRFTDLNVTFTEGENGVILVSLVLDATKHLFEEDQESGTYYIGVSATNSLDNESIIYEAENALSFDIRSEIAANVYLGNSTTPLVDDEIKNAYVIDVSGGEQTINIKFDSVFQYNYHYIIKNFKKQGDSSIQPIISNYFDGYTEGGLANNNTITLTTIDGSVGYYEIRTAILKDNPGVDDPDEIKYTNIIRLYIINGSNSPTNNYTSIYTATGDLIVNAVFSLNITSFYYRSGAQMGVATKAAYNDSEKPLIFSSKNQATKYVKAMEYLDLYPVVLTAADIISYQSGNLRLDPAENHKPQVGEVWIRYKNAGWRFSTAQNDWMYYYYKDNSTDLDVSDLETNQHRIRNLSPNLYNAIDAVVATIISKGSIIYLNDLNGSLDSHGVPSIEDSRIPRTQSFTQTKMGTSLANNNYTFDSAIYSSNALGTTTNIATWHKFSYSAVTKIFYKKANSSNDYEAFKGNYLADVVSESGIYLIKEYDENGMNEYQVYVDKTAPTIIITYQDIRGNDYPLQWINEDAEGTFLHTNSFKINMLFDNEYDQDYNVYKNKTTVDQYAYVSIVNITTGESVLENFASIKEKFSGANPEGILLPEGVFEIIVSDRSGNRFSFMVSVIDKEKALKSEITVIKNDKIVVSIPNRDKATISSFVYNNRLLDRSVDFASAAVLVGESYQITFKEAGFYGFTITDLYGYTIRPDESTNENCATLTRVNIRENDQIQWFTRSDSGEYTNLKSSAIDDSGETVIYLKTNEALTIRLDSKDIYSYEFTGNVKYNVINKDKYVYIDTTSTERWSLRLYYTDFPDNFVTYNRVGETTIVPAEINLYSENTNSVGIVQPDSNNNIIVYVEAKTALTGDVNVTIRTKNRSAIAELGDYEAYEATITLTTEQPKARIIILTHPSGFATYDNGYLSTRTFDVVIDRIEGNGEAGKSQLECAVSPEYEYYVVEKNGIKVFEAYLKGEKTLMSSIIVPQSLYGSQTGSPYDETQTFKVNSNWISNYLYSGVSDIYVSSGFDLADRNDELAGISQGDFRVSLVDSATGKSLFYVAMDKIGSSKSIMLGSSYSGVIPKTETYDKATSIVLSEARGNALIGRYYILPKNSNGSVGFNVQEYRSEMSGGTFEQQLAVAGLILAGTPFIIATRSASNLYGYSTLIDTTKPTVVGWYLDEHPLKVGEKMRLSVRFSEPVYINGKTPIVNARSKNNNLEFKYKGGAGTDTLYFEYDPENDVGDIVIDEVIFDSISYQGSIVDYAYNVNKENNKADLSELPKDSYKCNLDSRTPSVSMTNDIKSNPVRNTVVNLALTKVSTGAILYYSWTMDSDAPVDYALRKAITASDLDGVNIEGSGMSGVYYLHVNIESAYGKTETKTFGPFYFDNQAPVISDLLIEDDSKPLEKRTVSFTINELPKGSAGSEIEKIYLYYGIHGEQNNNSLVLYSKDGNKNLFEINENGRVSFTLYASDLGLQAEEQAYFDIGVYASDTLGNTTSIANYTFYNSVVNFDTRSSVSVTASTAAKPIFTADGIDVYDSNVDLTFRFTFSYQADEYNVNEFYLGDTLIEKGNYANYFSLTNETDGLTLTINRGLVGYVRLKLNATSGSGESEISRDSNDFSFYMSNGFSNSITNNFGAINSGTLLINKVYFLGSYAFYYHDGTSIKQISYNNTSLLQAFSSKEKAKEYLRYYEILDLGILRINSQAIADSLNSGDGSYRKASQDNSISAEVDQVWIRYKRSTWSESTSPDAWVYYYYGSISEIDLDNLPQSLSQAIDQVVETIASKGRYEYLTNDNEGLDKYNSPVLDKKQINTERMTTYSSMSNVTYRAANTFVGDPNIYNSKVTPAGFDTCSLATTYQFVYSNYTKLFYAKDDGLGRIPEEDLKALPEGTVFGELDLVEGIYWVREIDENGARDYRVYIDKTAPSVLIRYINAKDDEITTSFDSSVNGISYGWKSAKILGITNEIDDMAYVAVYKKNGVLYGVYRKDEIPTSGVEIPEGVYYFEILDRSGNMYKVNIALTDSPLEVKVRIENNRYLKVDCNREENQIVSYEIYLDDLLLESNYLQSASYYQAGSYRVYVRDSFGFNYDGIFELRRDLPTVSWYYNENSTYVQYDGTQDFIQMNNTGEKEYQITTNRLLTFMFDDSSGYEYEFNQKGISSQSNYSGKVRVTLNKEVDWTLTVRYERYPEVAVVYRCTYDNTAPVITVDASQDIISYNDQAQVNEANLNITSESPNIFTPTDIFFTLSNSSNFSVRDGQTIYSNLVKVKCADKSVCTEVRVFLDDILITESIDPNGVKDVTLSRLGTYVIVAKDTLGNESRFTFTNEETVNFEYVVDDELKALKKNPSTLIINENYPTDSYGYKYAAFNYNGSATIVFLIKKGEEARYLRYRLFDGTLYEVEYIKKEVKDEAGNKVLDVNGNPTYSYSESYSEPIIANINSETPGSSFRIADAAKGFVNIYLKLDKDMNISYYVEAINDEVTVYARLNYSDINEPYFAKTILCGSIPTVTLVHTSPDSKTKEIIPESTDRLVSLNGEFMVKNIDFKENQIKEVLISYSETTEFVEYITIYNQELGYEEHRFSEDGLYSLIVTNTYGCTAEYILILASDFRVVTKAVYDDDVTNQYSVKNSNIIKTNNQIEIDIYSTYARYTVTYNGIEDIEKEVFDDNGISTLVFDNPGLYSILIIDGFENEVRVQFEIEAEEEIAFKQGYLTGYNEKALRYEEGYTNKRLSINADMLLADNIKEISMIYDEKTYPIFNLLVENPTDISDDDLNEVIGKFGDGVYTVFIRNEYGNTATYDIHYLETTPLTLTRQIRTSTVKEPIELTEGENKVYSNFLVNLQTVASRFDVKVDGATKDMPLELRFPTDGETDEGEYIYTVTYLDEYGFEYTIEVNLVRKELSIDLDKHMKVEVIDDVNMTKSDVQIDFEKGLKCEYTINGSERYPYESGNILTSDGTYRFYLTDKAGNIHTATIKKDTIVEYIFTYEGTERVVENGSVINKGKVKFSPVNGDSAEIKIIALNGEQYSGTATTTFGEDGKWELLIEDKMHNSSYFIFHIITHSLSAFDYTTPYTYKITDLIYDSGDGIEISYLGDVVQNDYTSRMKFLESGKYYVTAKSPATATVLTFEVSIDKVPPKVELVGAANGAATTENVTIKGCQANDVVKVYKNGELIQTIKVTTSSTKMPEIREQGEYKIEVINLAGNVTTLTFTRKYTANVATTIAIMAALVFVSTAIFIGLVYRKRMKV